MGKRVRKIAIRVAVQAVALAGASACAGSREAAPVMAAGEASYYADKFNGRPTASGEAYDPNALTAAHRTLPFGTRVRVTDVVSGRSVVVRINDRGPWRKQRVIDLSRAAARKLGLIQRGIGQVQLSVAKRGD
jgi:rare lipoprotein A